MDSVVTWKLKSKDGKIFEADENILQYSEFLKGVIKDFPNNDQPLEITEVNSKSLEKVIEYLKHYEIEKPKEIPRPLPGSDLKALLSEWDYNFINPIPLEEVIDLINAANYLNIADLVNLCSAKCASEMTNCTVEEARDKFGIVPDMTEEEMREYDKYPLD